ncbi:MAG: tRNA uridine-5-carboxymethylaminomethyl(34) synthesis GTPase MnmE [Clostridia bacterium]|nr:tRNA uridine-5-carboxymethylaminomethyl(34) synthesis GTPase MnmE [Clostridia bacterium]
MFETIAAVSTPPGKGGVSLIRVSGEDAVSVASAIFRPMTGAPLTERESRRAVFGTIHHPTTGEVIDTGLAVLFRAPASFTGEDVAEISCHGGTAVTRATLAAVFAAGAAPAGPGDFTRRAFVNGKMTLSEAQAIGLLIDADTESRRALASGAARGNVSRALDRIATSLTEVLSALYAAIDYPEEDVGDEGERQILTTVQTTQSDLDALRRTYKTGVAIAEGIPTVIAGLPNSGKSSLYNALLGREEAIVTDIPGTTRDVLSASADIGGVTLLLSDTAGIREGNDAVEMIGVQRAKDKLAGASLVLFVLDAGAPLTPDCTALFEKVCDLSVPTVVILNKSDTGCALSAEEIASFTTRADYTISLSAKTGDGMEELRRVIAEIAGTDKLDTENDAVIWDARQEASLTLAYDLLGDALYGLTMGDPLDAVCTVCETALAEIRGVDGRAVDEDIIAGIFARFCVGK